MEAKAKLKKIKKSTIPTILKLMPILTSHYFSHLSLHGQTIPYGKTKGSQ
jgi:hypothetical protein